MGNSVAPTAAAGVRDAEALGQVARYVILVLIMLSLDQLNIGSAILVNAFLIVLGGLVLAMALARAGRTRMAAQHGSWWPSDKSDDRP